MRLAFLSLAWAVLAGSLAAPAAAEEWIQTASSSTAVFETDVSTLSVKQEVVQSWMRETLNRPDRDRVTHKAYTVTIMRRSDDCERRKYAFGEYVRRDPRGQVVAQGTDPKGWQDVIPGSVAEGIWRIACAAGKPPAEKPWAETLAGDDWRGLGLSVGDKPYNLFLKTDAIVKVKDGYVLTLVRADYVKPFWVDGLPIRYIVTASLTDCVNEKNAPAGEDLYVSSSTRVRASRIAPARLTFVPVPPGSFLAKYIKDICGAATAQTARGTPSREDAQVYSGTAWGVDKGYLVTASHVVEDGKRIVVYSNGERVGEAKVVLADPANDLAILRFAKPPAAKLKTLSLAQHGATLGRSVFTLGYPAPETLGQRIKMTAGQVSSTAGFQDDARYLQISIPIQGGNSGGPVIAADGTVLGVIEAKLTRLDDDPDSPAPENVNYAIKSSYIRPMLDDLPDLGNYETIKGAGDQDQLIDQARAAVFMLVVSK